MGFALPYSKLRTVMVAAAENDTELRTQAQSESPGPPPAEQPEIPLFIEHVTPSHWLFHSRIRLTLNFLDGGSKRTPAGKLLLKGLGGEGIFGSVPTSMPVGVNGYTLSVEAQLADIWQYEDQRLLRQIVGLFEEAAKYYHHADARIEVIHWPPNAS